MLTHHPSIVKNGLVAYFDAANSKSYPTTGTAWNDLTKNKNIGTFVNSPTYNSANGGSISFTTSYISSPSATVYQLGFNDFTIQSWVYLNAYPLNNNGVYASMIICKDLSGSRAFDFFISGSSSANTALQFTGFTNNTTTQAVSSSFTLQLSTWYHVSVSRIGNLMYLYVNGNLLNAGGTAFTATIQSTTSEVRIGAQVYGGGYNYYVNGRIATVKLYNGIGLTANQILQNYNATKSRYGY